MTSIEYPLNVENSSKAIELTGGTSKILSNIRNNEPLELRLRPNDIYLHPIEGKQVHTDNLLLKVTVPKNEFREKYNGDIQAYLKAKGEGYKVEAVGIINRTYRFREMADFQYITKNSQFAEKIRKSIFGGDLNEIKSLQLDVDEFPWSPVGNRAVKDKELEIPPPPRFSSHKVPFIYNYQMNPNAAVNEDESTGEKVLINTNKASKLFSIIVDWDVKEVPKGPRQELLAERDSMIESINGVILEVLPQFDIETLFETIGDAPRVYCLSKLTPKVWQEVLQKCVAKPWFWTLTTIEVLERIFHKQPILSRKKVNALLDKPLKKYLKVSLPYVSYTFRKGPWRSGYVKYGVDPRSDAKYAPFQTESFRIIGVSTAALKKLEEGATNFEFDGTSPPNSLFYQVMDLKDPDILRVLGEDAILSNMGSPDAQYGWYDPKAMETVRKLMRYKLPLLIQKEQIDRSKVEKIIMSKNELDDAKDDSMDISDDGELSADEFGAEKQDTQLHAEESGLLVQEDNILDQLQSVYHYDQLKHLVGIIKP